MNFEFSTAPRIIFGCGAVKQLPLLASQIGKRALLLGGNAPERLSAPCALLRDAGIEPALLSVPAEPTTIMIDTMLHQISGANFQMVLAVGGGAVLDAGKTLAALLANGGKLLDYLEVVGTGKPLTAPSLPLIAVPTTAGTGTEATKNAVIGVPDHNLKASLRSPYLLPQVALIDPELTYTLPREITAASGLDALTQLIEPFVSNRSSPLTDSVCREGLARAARALPALAADEDNHGARKDMCLASLCGGIALANAALGAVHGLAGVIGGFYPIPHGVICARLLPLVMKANIRALSAAGAAEVLGRFREVAQILTGRTDAIEIEGAVWSAKICEKFGVPDLGSFGLQATDFKEISKKALNSNSMRGNPTSLSEAELAQVLRDAASGGL